MIIPKTALCAWHVSFSAETLLVGDQYRTGYLITKDYYLEDSIGTSPSLSNVWKWTLNKTESSSVILCAWYDLRENVLLINTRTFSNYRHHHRHYNPPPPPHHHQQQRGLEPVQNKDHFQQKMMYVSARCCWIPPLPAHLYSGVGGIPQSLPGCGWGTYAWGRAQLWAVSRLCALFRQIRDCGLALRLRIFV